MPFIKLSDDEQTALARFKTAQPGRDDLVELDDSDPRVQALLNPPLTDSQKLNGLIADAQTTISAYWIDQLNTIGEWPDELQLEVAGKAGDFLKIVNSLQSFNLPLNNILNKGKKYIAALPDTFDPVDPEDQTVYSIAPLKASLTTLFDDMME